VYFVPSEITSVKDQQRPRSSRISCPRVVALMNAAAPAKDDKLVRVRATAP
jgi:hypothetical protein